MQISILKRGTGFAIFTVVSLAASSTFAEVFVPEGSAGTALRLSADHQIVGRITGLGNVHGMDVALSRGVLVSASLDEQPRGEIPKPEGVSVSDHDAHHSGKKKTASKDVSIVSLVDMKSGKITRQIEVPGMVHHITVGADDRYALATHPGLDAVSIIDLDKNEVTAIIQTGPNPNYAVYDPTTGAFFVSNAGNSTISQVDPVEGYVVRNYKTPAGVEHLDIDVAGRRLFAAQADAGELTVMNLDSGDILATYQIGGGLHGVAFDAARDAVYVSARDKGAIAWIDLGTGDIVVENIGSEPYHMALDGDRLLVSSADEDLIWVLDVPTRVLLKTIATDARGHQMVVIPGS